MLQSSAHQPHHHLSPPPLQPEHIRSAAAAANACLMTVWSSGTEKTRKPLQ